LDRTVRQEVILRADKADKDLKKIEEKLQAYDDDPQMKSYALSKERLRCPLLDVNQACTLYPFRPITCRVYGIPTAIQGKARVCGRAGFKKGESYPTFDLDGAYRALYQLSKDLVAKAGLNNMEQASLLLSVSKAIKTPLKDLMQDSFE
jgi:Fe-S-cluster containining protein